MTRQEAIKILKSKMDGSVDTSYEWAEAVRMAIEALKIQDESKTKNIIYDFLIAKLGEDIMNNPFKFEDWFNRMVWHVQECYKLNKKLLMNTGDYDLISRQDYGANMRGYIEVLNEIKSGYISDCGNCGGGDKSHCGDFCFDFSAIQALNLAIKALEQKPKRGKWIAIDDTHSQCMECGAIFCITSSNEWEVNYCPNCGARVEDRKE